jgi:hypothetical protein
MICKETDTRETIFGNVTGECLGVLKIISQGNNYSDWDSKLVELMLDWWSVGLSAMFSSTSLGLMTRFFSFFCRKIALLFVLGRPLWREDGSVICSAICQWSESRRARNHTLLSHLRLLGSFSFASCDSQWLRWKYSNPPPHGEFEARTSWIRSKSGNPSTQKFSCCVRYFKNFRLLMTPMHFSSYTSVPKASWFACLFPAWKQNLPSPRSDKESNGVILDE